jgi:hypothetical protein
MMEQSRLNVIASRRLTEVQDGTVGPRHEKTCILA